MDLTIACLKNCINDSFLEKLEKELGFKNIQTYFPVMDNYFNIYNFPDCHLNYTLNNRYQINRHTLKYEERFKGEESDTASCKIVKNLSKILEELQQKEFNRIKKLKLKQKI